MSRSGPGAFVYAGSGKIHQPGADLCQRKCKVEACGIQYCLQRNNHVQSKCEDIITVYKTCCENAKAVEEQLLAEKSAEQKS
jgi:hypothetical protein